MPLSKSQKKLISNEIKKEFKLKGKAIAKRFEGKSLTSNEKRRIRRESQQIIAIGFSKAREKDPSIPKRTKLRSLI